jgi:hypothetical protein
MVLGPDNFNSTVDVAKKELGDPSASSISQTAREESVAVSIVINWNEFETPMSRGLV